MQSWRSAKELEEGYISYTYRYSQLLDLVGHPCRLLYKVSFFAKLSFPVIIPVSVFRQSSISGKLKGELGAIRAISTRFYILKYALNQSLQN